jgi:hypothetical protein
MSNLDDLFAAARRAGIGVLVINNLEIHNGDNITAENVASGDINASRNLTIPREMLQAPRSDGRNVACTPLDPYVAGWYAGERQRADAEYAARGTRGRSWYA